MRVNQPGGNQAQGSEVTGPKQGARGAPAHEARHSDRGAAASETEKPSRGEVNSEISSKSREFAHAKAVASDAPDVRDERISELKRRIADKSYNVDHEAVADRLVDDHLRMSGIG